jgi:uncharacterized protein YndB with AHSA1/START domain
MPEQSVTHSTFAIERRYPGTPERVFAAFADKSAKRRWYADGKQMAVEEFEMDFRVGGHDVARFRMGEGSPFPGTPLVFNTTYQDIVANRRLVYAYTLTFGDKIVSASLVTFEFLSDGEETDVLFTEQGAFFEGSGGPQMREEGWRVLLEKLAGALAE